MVVKSPRVDDDNQAMNSNRWKVALCGALLVGGSLGVAGATGVFSDDTRTFAVGDLCRNPGYTDDGFIWGTEDVFPAGWEAGREVEGNVERLDSENQRFTSVDGTVTFDFHIVGEEGGFHNGECRLG